MGSLQNWVRENTAEIHVITFLNIEKTPKTKNIKKMPLTSEIRALGNKMRRSQCAIPEMTTDLTAAQIPRGCIFISVSWRTGAVKGLVGGLAGGPGGGRGGGR